MSNHAAGSYLRHLHNPAEDDPINQGARRMMGDRLSPESIRKAAEPVREAHQEALRADQAYRDRVENQKTADAFTAGHPEYVDNVANGQLLLNQMNTMFGEGLHTLAHHEQAYEHLRTKTNFLKLDKTVLAAQQKTDAKQRFEAEQARIAATKFDSNADYSALSLEQLRERAIEEHQQQMRQVAERGGYDIG